MTDQVDLLSAEYEDKIRRLKGHSVAAEEVLRELRHLRTLVEEIHRRVCSDSDASSRSG